MVVMFTNYFIILIDTHYALMDIANMMHKKERWVKYWRVVLLKLGVVMSAEVDLLPWEDA